VVSRLSGSDRRGGVAVANRPRRLLFGISQLGIGGCEGQLRRLAAALAARGAAVSVFSLASATASPDTIVPLQETRFGTRRGPYDPRPVSWLAREIERTAPDYVVTFDRHTFLYALAARLWGRSVVPIVNRALETDGLVSRSGFVQLALARRLLRSVDRLAALSGPLAEFLAGSCGFPRQQITTIAVGVDTGTFHPLTPAERDEVRATLGIPAAAPLLVHVANLSKNKNHEMSLRTLQRLVRSEFPECRLIVVGRGEDARVATLQALAASMRLESHVQFLGPRVEVAQLIGASDVLLLTSHAEATPNVVLEALACGVPPVVRRYRSASDQFGSALADLVVDGEGDDAFVARVAAVLRTPSDRERVLRFGRPRVCERFSMSRAVADWERLLGGAP
jgi:glycosyltransferase involved in cell wall biosynthesis